MRYQPYFGILSEGFKERLSSSSCPWNPPPLSPRSHSEDSVDTQDPGTRISRIKDGPSKRQECLPRDFPQTPQPHHQIAGITARHLLVRPSYCVIFWDGKRSANPFCVTTLGPLGPLGPCTPIAPTRRQRRVRRAWVGVCVPSLESMA